jgi:hypothetical protein
MARRRHVPPPAPDLGDPLPVELRSNRDPIWWDDDPPTAAELADAEQHLKSNPGQDRATEVAWCLFIDRFLRARRRHADARTPWCAERGLLDEHGRIDWTRFGPIQRAAQPVR